MGRRLTKSPKVVGRLNDSTSEQMMPNSIHEHASWQRIIVAKQVLGELQATTLVGFLGRFIDRFQEASWDLIGGLFVVAANE